MVNQTMTLECQAVIFDLDGTLVDSTNAIRRIWQEWGDRHGLNNPDLLDIAISMRTVEAVRFLAPHLNTVRETEYLELAEATELDGVGEIEGARELLLSLPREAWGIVTSITSRTAIAKLNHVGLPIPIVLVTANDVDCGKPAPDGYLFAAEHLGLATNQCVVIEDTPPGIQSACAAGMVVIGLSTTLPVKLLQEASIIVSSLKDIQVSIQPAGGFAQIEHEGQLMRLCIKHL